MTNIYRQAKRLLDKRDTGSEISWEELQLIKTAELPLILRGCPLPEDMPVGECLETLAQIVERAREDEKTKLNERANAREKTNEIEQAKLLEKTKKKERAIGKEKPTPWERASVDEKTMKVERASEPGTVRKPRRTSDGRGVGGSNPTPATIPIRILERR